MAESTPRRSFIGRAAATAAAMMGGSILGRDLGAQSVTGSTSASPRRPVSDTWDMSWVDRVTGTHRMVFDCPNIEAGTVLHQAFTWMKDYQEVYGAKDSDMSGVIVIRHAAIHMVLNDKLWDELDLARTLASMEGPSAKPLPDPVTGEPARRNPFVASSLRGGRFGGMAMEASALDSLMARGVTILCCNLALRRAVSIVASKDGVDQDTARAKVLANLVPGVIVMPSGIFAVTRAQEAGCNFLQV